MGDDDLRSQIEAARKAHADKHRPNPHNEGTAKGMALGFRMATEFAVGPLVGAGIGWALDLVLHTKPWMLIVWMLFGFAAGVLNVLRTAKELQGAPGSAPETGVEGEE